MLSQTHEKAHETEMVVGSFGIDVAPPSGMTSLQPQYAVGLRQRPPEGRF